MSDGTCTVEGCERPSRRKRGLCNTHYERKRHTGDVGGSEIRRYQPQRSLDLIEEWEAPLDGGSDNCNANLGTADYPWWQQREGRVDD